MSSIFGNFANRNQQAQQPVNTPVASQPQAPSQAQQMGSLPPQQWAPQAPVQQQSPQAQVSPAAWAQPAQPAQAHSMLDNVYAGAAGSVVQHRNPFFKPGQYIVKIESIKMIMSGVNKVIQLPCAVIECLICRAQDNVGLFSGQDGFSGNPIGTRASIVHKMNPQYPDYFYKDVKLEVLGLTNIPATEPLSPEAVAITFADPKYSECLVNGQSPFVGRCSLVTVTPGKMKVKDISAPARDTKEPINNAYVKKSYTTAEAMSNLGESFKLFFPEGVVNDRDLEPSN